MSNTNTVTDYPLPPYVYKILPSPPPTPLPSALPLSDLDRHDGFIHLSTAAQVPTTASLFFASARALSLLKVDTRKTRQAGGTYRWVEGMPGCPHLYAGTEGEWVELGSGNVSDWTEVRREEGQSWEEAFKGLNEAGWLVDE
ncbi:hypothetical protein PYCCODRAFT_607232 [Trametes coccinea BRFM310]|uniref:DUF952-domain-containing protein n=1 Tax=Trametes coccinea (strain BRFM310) TaxID=1353009 RepID=A0A1Y2J5A8_TRAC3|nr:hypothetical protein PYCCODRAFT_607232 [Trametes coccinea BRFM310]